MLSEINNTVCTVLKDFRRGVFFFTDPKELLSGGWWVGGVLRGYETSPAGVTVQTTAS